MILPRKAVQSLAAYVPPLEGRRESMRLDFNENTVGFADLYDRDVPLPVYIAYPEYAAFEERLAAAWNVPRERLLLTNASDEGIFVIASTFIEPDVDTAITATPTFALIPHSLRLAQARLIEVPITADYAYDLEAIERALAAGAKMAMFASPDNPVGCMLAPETVGRWCRRWPDTLFAIDEAYVEYAGVSVIGLLDAVDNLVLTRTFSKAWGLAGLRLGVILGSPALIEFMRRVRSPYSVNSYALSVASRLLDQAPRVEAEARATMARKAETVAAVRERGFSIVEGRANFFMLALGSTAGEFCAFFRRRGILVRDRSSMPGLHGMVRVSIGSADEMAAFIEGLDGWLDEGSAVMGRL